MREGLGPSSLCNISISAIVVLLVRETYNRIAINLRNQSSFEHVDAQSEEAVHAYLRFRPRQLHTRSYQNRPETRSSEGPLTLIP